MKKVQRTINDITMIDQTGWPMEHMDELGPTTHREIIANQYDHFERIHQALVPDKDAVTREDRVSNKLQNLRPKEKGEYFGANDTDERSNMMLRNETRATKARKTMAPTSSAQSQILRQANNTHRLMMPSKTPTLGE